MSGQKLATCCLMLLCLLSSGCHLFGPRRPKQTIPVIFQDTPSAQDIIQVVNKNTLAVRQLQAPSASLKFEGVPTLTADLALERPRRFRLRGSVSSLTGREVDIGSNNEHFWLWVKRQRPKAFYFARHDEFSRSEIARTLPVRPNWLVEALGLVELDPNGRHEGPSPAGPNRLLIRSWIPTQEGTLVRDLVVHDKAGWVMAQHVYDSRGKLLASVKADDHRIYKEHDATLPHKLDIKLSTPQFGSVEFQLRVDNYTINYLLGEEEFLWKMPNYRGFPLVDLSRQRLRSGRRDNPEMLGRQRYSRVPDYRMSRVPRVRGMR